MHASKLVALKGQEKLGRRSQVVKPSIRTAYFTDEIRLCPLATARKYGQAGHSELYPHLCMTTTKLLRRGAIALSSLEFGLASAYLLLMLKHGTTPTMLDFNGLRTLPSLMQAAHLFAIGGLCLVLLAQRSRWQADYSWYLPLALAGLCLLGGLDELTKLHLQFKQINWPLMYLGLLAVIPIASWRDLVWLWRSHRATLLWVAVGLAIFLLGGFGAEFLQAAIAATASQHSSTAAIWAEYLRITLEEFAELCGETVILYAFLTFTVRVLGRSEPPLRERVGK